MSSDPILLESSVIREQLLQDQAPIPVSFVENPEEEEELAERGNNVIESAKERYDLMQAVLEDKMRKMSLDVEIFFHEEKIRTQEALDKNQLFNQDIPILLTQLEEYDMALESLEAYEKAEKLDLAFENDVFLVQQQQSFQRDQKNIQDGLVSLEQNPPTLNLKPFPSELIEQISGLYASKAEAMFNLLKMMNMFRLGIDEEGWLGVSRLKGKDSYPGALCFEDVRNLEKLDLKIDHMGHTEMMIFGLSFLLENCLEKVTNLCFSFCGRFISNQEARRFNACFTWSGRKVKLTVDFTDCIFESEDTLLIFFQDKISLLESLDGFKYFVKTTNATQKTLEDFSKLIISKMKNLEKFGFDLNNLCLENPGFHNILAERASALIRLDFSVQKTAFTDVELIALSEEILPKLINLKDLGLWFDNTQITDKGLFSLFKSLEKNCAGRLKTFILGIGGTNIINESLQHFGFYVLPLMENLEEFRLLAERTPVTEKGLIPVLKSVRYFASKLRILGLDLESTAVGDEAINTLALSVYLMERMEHLNIWLSGTKVTDQSMINLYSLMASSDGFSDVWRLELDCGETAVTDESVAIFAKRVLPKMEKLKKFAFYANKTKLSDSSAQALFENIPLEKIVTLTISLNETEVGDPSIHTLAKKLSSLANLKNLNLWLNNTKAEDLSVNFLCASLKSVARNLECLSLAFDDLKITDQAIAVLGKEVAPEMKSLRQLRFWVSRTKVGDAGLIPLFENLKGTMANIQVLQLCLSNSLVSDQALLALANESLPRAESFRTLELWITDTSASDLSLAPLMESLGKSVHDISKLVFSCIRTNMTDLSLAMFSQEIIENSRNLRDVQFFIGQSKMTGTKVKFFLECLAKKVRNIQKFELELSTPATASNVSQIAHFVLPNMICVQEFKLFWGDSLPAFTNRALCLYAEKTIKNIKTFDIRSSSFCITTDQSFPSGETLQSLGFEFDEMDDSIMEEIIGGFEGQVSQVKTFSFVVKGTEVSDKSVKALANSCFLLMPNLESLTINLDKLTISDEAFCFMSRSLEQFASQLKFFKISLNVADLGDESISTLGWNGLAYMRNLESLEVNFSTNKIFGQGLVNLFTEMQNCASGLQSLSLTLPGPKIPVEAIEALSTLVFPKLKNLTSFQAGIYETNMSDSDFVLFFSGLKGVLGGLKWFVLGLYEDHITDQALDILSTEIIPQLGNVETFRCYSANNQKMTSDGLIRFYKKFQEVCGKIQCFMMRLENMNIQNEAVDEFALKTLCEMKSLKELDFSFGHNAGVNDESIVNLFDGLEKIVGRLSSLQIGLHSTGLTDVSIEGFKERLAGEKTEHLGKFSMNITGNDSVSQENENLIESMRR